MSATPQTSSRTCFRCGRAIPDDTLLLPAMNQTPICPECLLNDPKHRCVKVLMDHDLAEIFRYYR